MYAIQSTPASSSSLTSAEVPHALHRVFCLVKSVTVAGNGDVLSVLAMWVVSPAIVLTAVK